jgi:hypothetical protein
MVCREFEHWHGVSRGEESRTDLFEDSVLPVVRAGLFALATTITPSRRLMVRKRLGHTPGNVVIHARSRRPRRIPGRCAPSPAPAGKPEWSTLACTDRTSQDAHAPVEEQASAAPPAPAHFPAPTVGRVVGTAAGYRYAFSSIYNWARRSTDQPTL